LNHTCIAASSATMGII